MTVFLIYVRSRLSHLVWRLGIFFPALFGLYTVEEEQEDTKLNSRWLLWVIAILIMLFSIWSFT